MYPWNSNELTNTLYEEVGKMKILVISFVSAVIIVMFVPNYVGAGILNEFQQAGIWKVDKTYHRCSISHSAWIRIPYHQKEQVLWAIYLEEKAEWEVYDDLTKKLLAKVGSWGVLILERDGARYN